MLWRRFQSLSVKKTVITDILVRPMNRIRRSTLLIAGSLLLALLALASLHWLDARQLLSAAASQGNISSPQRPPLPDFDIRADAERARTRSATDGARRNGVSATAPGSLPSHARVRWSSISGGASRITSQQGRLTPPTAEDAESVARNFIRTRQELFRLSAADVDRMRLARRYRTRHNGLTHLFLKQEVNGIEVFQSTLAVHIDQRGSVIAANGEVFPSPAAAINLPAPRLSMSDSLRRAAIETGAALGASIPLRRAPLGRDQAQVIAREAGFARDAAARLVYFPLSTGQMRLAWEFQLWMSDTPDAYLILIDAENGAMLFRYNLTSYDENPLQPRGMVFTGESPRPNSPYTGNNDAPFVERVEKPFRAEPFNGQTIFNVSDPHYDWWAGVPANTLISNNTDTHLDRDAAPNQPDLPRLEAADGNFTFAVNFDEQPTDGDNPKAAQVNLFYWINRYHDILYAFGFDEAAGNFQKDNFGLGGNGNDAIQADAQDGGGMNNANFSTPPDGSPGRVQMYLWNSTPQLLIDGDFDQGVIIHELTHGLSNRLIGNASGLLGTQARGMGEGWSDYFSLVLLRNEADDKDGSYPIGQYVTNRASRGIRLFPYSTSMSVSPLTFADIADNTESHAIGEIWCAMLWEMRALLVERYGFQEGQRQSVQLVVDGMKLTPSAPTLADARDAILLADRVNNNGANQCLIWKAFAKRGLGFSALTTDPGDTAPKEAFDEAPFCSATGVLSLDRANYLPGEQIRISLGDGNAPTQVSVQAVSSMTGDTEIIPLVPDETTPGHFTASIQLVAGVAQPGDGRLQIAGADGGQAFLDQIRVSYEDLETADGAASMIDAHAGVARERSIFSDNVESGNLGWLPTGTWAIDNTTSSSSTRSWRVSSSGNNNFLPAIALTSPLLDLTGVTDVSLNFAQRHDLFAGFNYGIIEYSTDDGETWSRVKAFTGFQNTFATARIRLPGLDGQGRARVRFRLQNGSSISSNFWAIDDIEITGRSGSAQFIPPGALNAPFITRITPSFTSPLGGSMLFINGENFTESQDMSVTFDGIPATDVTVISRSVMTLRAPAHPAGPASVRIANRRGATTYPNGFTFYIGQEPAPQPSLQAIAPASGSINGGTAVTIYGNGFIPTTRVNFGITQATVVFINSTTLQVVSPSQTMTGEVDVTVQNGDLKATLIGGFTYTNAIPPQVEVLSPAGGGTFYLGGTIPVVWRTHDNRRIVSHSVQLIYPLGPVLLVSQLPGSTQSFNIQLGPTLGQTNQARIRVTATDDEGITSESFSAEFAIQQRWNRVSNLPSALQRLQAASDGRYLYAIGGRTGTNNNSTTSGVTRYDPETNTWSNGGFASLPAGLNAGDAAFLDGRIYLPGGYNTAGAVSTAHFAYDVEMNTWAQLNPSPQAVVFYSLVADAPRERIHLTGGGDSTGAPSRRARSYQPSTNSWTELGMMGAARYGHESALIGGKLYVAGGIGPTGGLTSCEVYDFSTGEWSPIASLNQPRAYGESVVTSDATGNPLWLISSGLDPATGLPLGSELYDVQNDRWIPLDPSFNPAVTRAYSAGAAVGNTFYLVGGANPTNSISAVERISINPLMPIEDNQPPVLVVPATLYAIAGQELRFRVTASDLGARVPLVIEAIDLPQGAEFNFANATNNSAAGDFTYTPPSSAEGETLKVTFRATDGQYNDLQTVTINVVKAEPLAVVNAADFRPGAVAPDSIVAAFGVNFSVRTEAAGAIPLPLEMAGTRVLVNNEPAQIFFISPEQVNFAIPSATMAGEASIIIINPTGKYSYGTIRIDPAVPAIFTTNLSGTGDAAALATADGVVFQEPPFDVVFGGQPNILVLFATGIRRAPASNPGDGNGVAEAVTATIDGQSATVHYAGAQGQFSGLDQLNIEIPGSLAGGPERRVEVAITVNGVAANRVTILIR